MSSFYKGINVSYINTDLILTIGDKSGTVNISSTNLTGTKANIINVSFANLSASNTSLSNAYLVNSHSVNSSVTNFSVSNASLSNAYLVTSHSVNSSVTNFSASNASLTTAYLVSSNSVNASVDNFSASNASLTTAYLVSSNSVNASVANFSASNASLTTAYVVTSNIVNSSATNFSASNGYITNVSGINASYTNVYVDKLYSITGTLYTTGGGGGTNSDFITYDNAAANMSMLITAKNLTINSSTYINQNLEVFGIAKANSFQSTSDKRTKINIEDLNRVTSLDSIRLLKPRMYDFIDSSKKQLGFIAQEIKTIEVLKPSINEGPGFIPNIYRTVTCDKGWFTLDFPLKKGDVIRYNINGKMNTTHILNASNPHYQLEEPLNDDIFLYGTKVQDFHSIEKDMIFTLSISAIQQLDEIVTQQQKSIDQLQVKVDSQQKTIDILLKKIDAILIPQHRIM